MKIPFVASLILALACCAMTFPRAAWAATGVPVKLLEITRKDDLALVRRLDTALDAFSTAVTACVGAGRRLVPCQCENIALFEDFLRASREVLSRRPAWHDRMLFVRDWEHSGKSLNLSMPGVIRAMKTKPVCR